MESHSKKIIISGASGLVGTALTQLLEDEHQAEVIHLVRSKKKNPGRKTVYWDPAKNEIDFDALEQISGEDGFDAIVHLSGANVAAKRWTEEYKKEILQSRVKSTKLLSTTVQKLQTPPKVWVSASASGYYGYDSKKEKTEADSSGEGFLANVCKQWEAQTDPIKQAGSTRVVNLRIGVVLSKEGGMLQKLLPVFKYYLGGPVGTGKQWMSWICLDDLVRAIHFCIQKNEIDGPVNAVAPHPVTNQQFTDALAKALDKPAKMRAPAFALKLALGKEMAEETVLANQKVIPKKLIQNGFEWNTRTLHLAL